MIKPILQFRSCIKPNDKYLTYINNLKGLIVLNAWKILMNRNRGDSLIDISLFCANVVEEQRQKLSVTKCMVFIIIINSISNASCHNQKQVFIYAYNFQGKLTDNQQNIPNILVINWHKRFKKNSLKYFLWHFNAMKNLKIMEFNTQLLFIEGNHLTWYYKLIHIEKGDWHSESIKIG